MLGGFLVITMLAQPAVADAGPFCVEASTLLAQQTATCTGLLVPRQQIEDALICKNVTVPSLEADLRRRTDLAAIAQQHAAQNIEFRDKLVDQLIKQPHTSSLSAWDVVALFSAGLASGIIIVVNIQ